MKRVEAIANRVDQRCPACGEGFVVGAGTRKRKVHCPKCREIVTIDPVQTPERDQEARAVTALTADREQFARIELLEARVEQLERQLAAGCQHSVAAALSTDQPETSHVDEEPAHPPEENPGIQEPKTEPGQRREAQSGNPGIGSFSPPPAGTFHIKANLRDPAARRLADSLADVLITAGWTSPAITELPSPSRRPGLTLTAASSVPSERLMTTFKALTASGFPVTLHLDPNPETTETVLVIGQV